MKRLINIVLTISMIFLSACQHDTITEYEDIQEFFNVPISVKAYGSNPKKAVDLAFERVAELELIFSNTIDDSEVSQINNSALNNQIKISNDMKIVLERSIYYSNLTDGAFDITINNLINLWAIGTDNAHVPNSNDISKYINLHDYNNIKLNGDTIEFTSETIQLNFGAISKGYISDEMKKILQDNGITSAILNLGGNVCTLGSKTDGSPWKVAITNPLDSSSYSGTLSIKDKSVITSGNYEKYFIENGVRYHHILDTSTGYPADNGIISVTIIGNNGIDCDALSTGCYVLGLDKSMELIETLPDYDAIIITDDGTIHKSSNIDSYYFKEIS